MTGALPKHSGRSYAWPDPSAEVAGASYWLEDVDVNGTRTMHGPVSVEPATMTTATAAADADVQPTESGAIRHACQPGEPFCRDRADTFRADGDPNSETIRTGGASGGQDLRAARGMVSRFAARSRESRTRSQCRSFVCCIFTPKPTSNRCRLRARSPGPGGFGPQAAINFYGTGIDTVFSGTRVYWLVAGSRPRRAHSADAACLGIEPAASRLSRNRGTRSSTPPTSRRCSRPTTRISSARIVSPTPVEQVLDYASSRHEIDPACAA